VDLPERRVNASTGGRCLSVKAEIATAPPVDRTGGRKRRTSGSAAAPARSILFNTRMRGTWAAPIYPAPRQRARPFRAEGEAMSTTCRQRGLLNSSSVARNAFTKVGRLRMKPTVSLTRTRRCEGAAAADGGSSVANRRRREDSGLGEPVEEGGLSGVGVTRESQRGQRNALRRRRLWRGRCAHLQSSLIF